MDKDLIEKYYQNCLDERFEVFQVSFDFEFQVFFELKTIVSEISHCLLLELYNSAITLTNHLLERLLKLSLINLEVGINSTPIEEWNSIYEAPYRKYHSITLGNSIEQCRKNKIITIEEKDFLFDVIREQMRNGFSHADFSKILEEVPDTIETYGATFDDPTNLKKNEVNPKIIPFLETLLIENFAKENAVEYFVYVLSLIERIEQRLIEFDK